MRMGEACVVAWRRSRKAKADLNVGFMVTNYQKGEREYL
jgi:hypothetical protein